MGENSLTAVSPIDGRYAAKLEDLKAYFSEYAMFKEWIRIEALYLQFLSQKAIVRQLTPEEIDELDSLYLNFQPTHARMIKQIEKKIVHDLKSVEYYMKQQLSRTSMADLTEFIHFGLTTWDINNISYSLLTKAFLQNIFLPTLKELLTQLIQLSQTYKSTPMLARTHGQPASPTTLGKEFAVFLERLRVEMEELLGFEFSAKLNGATGNFNAHDAAFPELDWPMLSIHFIESLGLKPNMITTQIEPYDNLAKLCHNLIRINNIVLNLDRDCWLYISQDVLIQKLAEEEVGSSTMPHKVNPIDFENSEGNLGLANAIFNHIANKLPISRLQRDLSDSTVKRNIGVPFAHSILAYKATLKGLGKIEANHKLLNQQLINHPEVLSEAIQTVLRKEGYTQPYEQLKELSRGKQVTLSQLHNFVIGLDINERAKQQLLDLEPANYTGRAEQLTLIAIENASRLLEVI